MSPEITQVNVGLEHKAPTRPLGKAPTTISRARTPTTKGSISKSVSDSPASYPPPSTSGPASPKERPDPRQLRPPSLPPPPYLRPSIIPVTPKSSMPGPPHHINLRSAPSPAP
ncbi:unnamed protein product [Dicrocoelium dendriticum]|nr:unnamed protein product [Dicrocoelium dendriticum]